MNSYVPRRTSEKFTHLALRQPYSLILKADIQPDCIVRVVQHPCHAGLLHPDALGEFCRYRNDLPRKVRDGALSVSVYACFFSCFSDAGSIAKLAWFVG